MDWIFIELGAGLGVTGARRLEGHIPGPYVDPRVASGATGCTLFRSSADQRISFYSNQREVFPSYW